MKVEKSECASKTCISAFRKHLSNSGGLAMTKSPLRIYDDGF